MKMPLHPIVLFSLLASPLLARETPPAAPPVEGAAPVVAWARQFGTAADDFGSALAVDRAGRCYIAGYTCGDLAAKNAGQKDLFVAAYDSAGQRLWITQLGSPADDAATAIALAPDGSLYVGGTTSGQLGSAAAGGSDVFLAKLDPAGRVLWVRQFGSAANDTAGALACDATGHVSLAGATEGRLGARHFGETDAFVLQLDPAGALVWTCQWGSTAADAGRGLTADADGNLYATGTTAGALAGTPNAGNTDLFVSQIDRTGTLVWTRQFGTPAPDQGLTVRVDADRSLYVAGSSGGDLAAPALGGGDAILLHLSPAGDLRWKKQFGTARWDGGHGIALPAAGRVIVGGCQNWDQCQGFLREFDRAGQAAWSLVIPSRQLICGTQVATDAAGAIYQTGGTHGPAFGDYAGTGSDIILVKLNPAP